MRISPQPRNSRPRVWFIVGSYYFFLVSFVFSVYVDSPPMAGPWLVHGRPPLTMTLKGWLVFGMMNYILQSTGVWW